MVRFLIYMFAFIAIAINSNAQFVDRLNQNGKREISSKYEKLYESLTGMGVYNLILVQDNENTDEISIYLHLQLREGDVIMSEGRKLLIKFDDDSIMELSNLCEVSPSFYTYGGLHHDAILSHPIYLLSSDNLASLLNKNAVKIRIDTDKGYFDKKINEKKFKEKIGKLYNQVLTKSKGSSNIRDGF